MTPDATPEPAPTRQPDTAHAIVAQVARIVDAVAAHARPVVLIDGRSGSGKTTLARALGAAIEGAQVVRLDDFYPGWDGLDEGSAAVVDDVLRAENPGWRSWDWNVGRPGTWHPLDPGRPLVIEGCGALSRASRPLASFGVWVELDASTRKHRALERDGSGYAEHWERWARQEERFIAREHPRSLADLEVDERNPAAP